MQQFDTYTEAKAYAIQQVKASKLAEQLYRDDMSRKDDCAVEANGYRAYDRWLKAAREAGDNYTMAALQKVSRREFAMAWNELVANEVYS